jgi:hypothetical protein
VTRCADACACEHCEARRAAELAAWVALHPDDPRWIPASEWRAWWEFSEAWNGMIRAAAAERAAGPRGRRQR